jgi:hypothetical protein
MSTKKLILQLPDDFPQEPSPSLSLPHNWVYVKYEDGTFENVANTDDLTLEEATDYAKRFSKKDRKVVSVMLMDSNRYVLKAYARPPRCTRKIKLEEIRTQ